MQPFDIKLPRKTFILPFAKLQTNNVFSDNVPQPTTLLADTLTVCDNVITLSLISTTSHVYVVVEAGATVMLVAVSSLSHLQL